MVLTAFPTFVKVHYLIAFQEKKSNWWVNGGLRTKDDGKGKESWGVAEEERAVAHY